MTATRATVVVLSAGASPFVGEVLAAAAAAKGPADELVVVWSGGGSAPATPGVDRTEVISPGSFNHGATRQRAICSSLSEYVAFLSDDATPATATWLDRLLAPFAVSNVGAVFGRQTPRADSPLPDRVFREARYPAESGRVQLSSGGLSPVVPVSNANAAYRVAALLAVGGFPSPCSFAEDRGATLRLLRGGWAVVYAGDAAVLHSHYHSWRQTVQRGEGAVSVPVFSGGLSSLREWARFGWRGVRSAWATGGLGAMASLGGAFGLRAAGLIWGRLHRKPG